MFYLLKGAITLQQLKLNTGDRHELCMSYSLNSLKGGYTGDYIGDYYRGLSQGIRGV